MGEFLYYWQYVSVAAELTVSGKRVCTVPLLSIVRCILFWQSAHDMRNFVTASRGRKAYVSATCKQHPQHNLIHTCSANFHALIVSPYILCTTRLRWRDGATATATGRALDLRSTGSNPTRGKSCVATLGKLFTSMCLCQQAV